MGIRAPYVYQPPLREAILLFKYDGVSAAGKELADLLAQYLDDNPMSADVLVPVPLHPSRRRERGYNQAEILGKALSQRLDVPLAPEALRRIRRTAPQAYLRSREERMQNVAGAFAPGPDAIQGQRVLLIDDVCTTGATLDECAKTLLAAGAAEVRGLTVARGG